MQTSSEAASHPPVKAELCPVALQLYNFFFVLKKPKNRNEAWEVRRGISGPRDLPSTLQQQSQELDGHLQGSVPLPGAPRRGLLHFSLHWFWLQCYT